LRPMKWNTGKRRAKRENAIHLKQGRVSGGNRKERKAGNEGYLKKEVKLCDHLGA